MSAVAEHPAVLYFPEAHVEAQDWQTRLLEAVQSEIINSEVWQIVQDEH